MPVRGSIPCAGSGLVHACLLAGPDLEGRDGRN